MKIEKNIKKLIITAEEKNIWRISLLLICLSFVYLVDLPLIKSANQRVFNNIIIFGIVQIIVLYYILLKSSGIYNKVVKIESAYKIFLVGLFPSSLILGINSLISLILFGYYIGARRLGDPETFMQPILDVNSFYTPIIVIIALLIGLFLLTYIFREIKKIPLIFSIFLSILSILMLSIISVTVVYLSNLIVP